MQNVMVSNVREQDRLIREALIEEKVKNIFLEAGAGAGKSSLMVDRIVHQIVTGAQKIDQIVAITFTEKAATELQKKVVEELDKIVTDLKSQSEKLALVEEIETKRHLLFVGTIHAFCQKLIQERPIESGVPVAFTMVEEDVEKNKRQQFYYKQLQNLSDEQQKLFKMLEEMGCSAEDLAAIFELKVSNIAVGVQEQQQNKALDLNAIEDDFASREQLLNETIKFATKPEQFINLVKAGYKNEDKLIVNNLVQHFIDGKQQSIILQKHIEQFSKGIDSIWKQLEDIDVVEKQREMFLVAEEKFEVEGMTVSLTDIFKKTILKESTMFVFLDKVIEKDEKAYTKAYANNIERLWPAISQQIYKIKKIANIEKIAQIFNEPVEGELSVPILKIFKISSETAKKLQNNICMLQAYMSVPSNIKLDDKYIESVKDEQLLMKNIVAWLQKFVSIEALESINGSIQSLLNDWAQLYIQQNLINGELTFDDLLYKAYIVLQDEEARQLFSRKYRHVYVDEVQDTDLLQMKILFLLTATSHPSSWATAETSPNSLFLVGDPKQSIYRFRNADLRIYDQIKCTATESENWRVENLIVNFRSTSRVTQWFNDTFDPKFNLQENTAIQPSYQAMNAFISEEELDALPATIDTGVNFYYVKGSAHEKHEGLNDSEKQVAYEAHEIVKWIHANNGKLQIVDRDKNKKLIARDMKYSDVLIIMPKMTNMEGYIRALQEAGIPTAFSGRINITGYKVVQRLIALSHYVAKPYIDTLCAAVAICENITLTDIYELQKNKSYEAMLEESLFKKYAELVDIARSMSPLSFLEYLIYHKTTLVLGESTSKLQYKTSMSLLTTFLEKIRPLQFVSLRQMSNEFRAMIASGYSLEYEMSVEQKEDAVRVMNLHKSKGLEAAIVFLVADSDSKEEKLTSYIERNDDKEDQAIYSLYKSNFGNTTIIYAPETLKPYEQELNAHAEAEEIRKLYVAATRAKQLLFVGLYEKASKKADENQNYYALYNKELIGAFNWEDLDLGEVDYDAMLYKVEELLESYDHVTSMDKSPSYEEISPSTLENGSFGIGVMEEEVALSLDSDLPNNIQPQQFGSRLWGSIVHAVFEMYVKDLSTYTSDQRENMLHQNFLPNYSNDEMFFTKAITRGLMQYDLTTNELAELGMTEDIGHNRNARLKQIIQNEAIRTALKQTLDVCISNDKLSGILYDGTSELYPELPFKAKNIQLGDLNEDENFSDVYMSGVIDLVVVGDDKVTIIDYKTNTIKPNEKVADFKTRLSKEYSRQMNAYKQVVTQIFNRDVQVYLYATGIDEMVEVEGIDF